MRLRSIVCSGTVLLVLFLLVGQVGYTVAQDRAVVKAYQIEAPVEVDGSLTEKVWQQAVPATGFRQFEPKEGQAATEETQVRVLYGPNSIYVGAVMFDKAPSQIRQMLGPRDDYNQADWFTVSIDSYFSQKSAYTFAVSASGVQLDGIRSGGGFRRLDESWDAIWESKVEVTQKGWTAELRIPYSMLRFSEGQTTWGIHFTRRIPRLGEEAEWPMVPRTERQNMIANYGLLKGLTDVEPRRNVQIRPYTVSRLQVQEHSQQPGKVTGNTSLDTGGDVKVGLSSSITLDATVNPDFGQVESDPAVLNLTAFETFYQERRPFFLEGVQIYEFDLGRRSDLLYTRRIGAQAPIIGASKLSGRTARGLSFGVLAATTGDAFSPSRYYGVARASQEIGSYSSAGGILTAFDGPTREGHVQSLVGGTDWDLRFLDNSYGVEGFATFTHRLLPADGQTSQTGIAASLEGDRRRGVWRYTFGASAYSDRFNPNDLGRKRRNNYVNLSTGVMHNINKGNAFGPFQQADAFLFVNQDFSYRRQIDQGASFFFRSDWTTRQFQRIELGASSDYLFGGYDLFETRGLGPRQKPLDLELQVEFQTDDRRNWELGPEFSINTFGSEGRSYALGLRGSWDMGTRLTLGGNLEFEWENDRTAWTANETFAKQEGNWRIGEKSTSPDRLEENEFASFDGSGRLEEIVAGVNPFRSTDQYYMPVYGNRDTRSLDFTLRSNVTFTPDLSLQFYSQLFAARGRYRDFQVLKNPDTLVPFASYPKQDVFAMSSFQTNTVLRWEYRPGSTLYLVWTQGRRAQDRLNPLAPEQPSPYDRSVDQQIADTFNIFPRNVFLVKFDYTFLR